LTEKISSLIVVSAALGFAQIPAFETGLYPVLERAGCRACHTIEGVASGTRLHFPEAGADAAKVEAFGRSLVLLVDREHPENSLLLRKPTARVAHAGGQRIKPGSPEEAALQAWIERLTKLSGAELTAALRYRELEDKGAGAASEDAELRRLTHSQYNHTVRDLLHDQTAPASQFPPEDFINGFRNQSRGQSMSPLLVEGYSAAAERLARSAFQGGDTRGLIPCKTASAACRARFVAEFGLKAFRRPLDAAEQARYEKLMARETELVKGAQLVVEAMLQSPAFLFRLDTVADAKLKPWAAASRLSYSLWDTMPDAELFAAAERGEFSTRAGLEKQTRRMLADSRARDCLNDYVSQWLRFDRLLTASKDRRKFPTYTHETAVAMTEEARAFFSDLVWNQGNFMQLFTAHYGYVSAETAPIYGVAAPAKDFDKVPFPPGSERAGLLGEGLFLGLTAKPDDSSPTARGLFVREQFLCQKVPDPPPGVDTNLPAPTEEHPVTNRDRMTAHASNPACATCHRLIDPIGFGFEKFDAVGARREQLVLEFRGKPAGGGKGLATRTVKVDFDTAGTVAGLTDSAFSSPAQLGAVLAKSAQCQECMVKQYFRYTAGRMETPADRPLILKALEAFRNSGYRFQELMVALTLLREFPEVNTIGGKADVADNRKPR
jgi:hypothetical protein